MKLLKAAVIFVVVPTLTPAFDPLSVSLVAGGAAMAWHLYSSDSWLKCRFQECCEKENTLNFRGEAVPRAGGAELGGMVGASFAGVVEAFSLLLSWFILQKWAVLVCGTVGVVNAIDRPHRCV